jgi:hypothetical protein
VGAGGAGTQFWLQTAKAKARTSATEPRGGTLIVSDRGIKAPRPIPFETPVLPKWSSPSRALVVSGGARVMAATLRFASIDLRDHASINSGPARLPFGDGRPEWISGKLVSQYCRGFCGADRLRIQAKAITVDATSRIDATGRGRPGGAVTADDAEAPAPRTPGGGPGSTGGFGGSHGGRGGRCYSIANGCPQGRAAKVYDSAAHPSQPGAGGGAMRSAGAGSPGGGVILINARNLRVDGRVTADGMATHGPSFDDPFWAWSLAGAGAGGSIAMKLGKLSGHGAITADGGASCPPESAFDPGPTHNIPHGCEGPWGGGGGGGRIAVCRAGGAWTGRITAAGGRIGIPTTSEARPGGRGTVVLARPAKKRRRC